jgi:hypothetical protein
MYIQCWGIFLYHTYVNKGIGTGMNDADVKPVRTRHIQTQVNDMMQRWTWSMYKHGQQRWQSRHGKYICLYNIFFTFKLSTSGKVVLERDRFATYCAKSNLELTRVARWFVFKTKDPNLGKFWRVLQRKMLVYFMETWSILRCSAIFGICSS